MSDHTSGGTFIELTAQIVSAYVSNNSVPADDLSALINQVHSAFSRVSSGQSESRCEPPQARDFGQEVDHARLHRLSRRRQEIQVAQAPSAHAIQHDARAIPREMGPAAGLSDGGAELRGRPLAARQADGPWPAAPAARNSRRGRTETPRSLGRRVRARPLSTELPEARSIFRLDVRYNCYRNLSLRLACGSDEQAERRASANRRQRLLGASGGRRTVPGARAAPAAKRAAAMPSAHRRRSCGAPAGRHARDHRRPGGRIWRGLRSRATAPRRSVSGQHLDLAHGEIETAEGRAGVTLDAGESPLAWLARRKGRDGRALIEPAQLQAGERLRADFTRAQLMPRITANWTSSVAQDAPQRRRPRPSPKR